MNNDYEQIHKDVTKACYQAVLKLQQYQVNEYGLCGTFEGTLETLFDIIKYNLQKKQGCVK